MVNAQGYVLTDGGEYDCCGFATVRYMTFVHTYRCRYVQILLVVVGPQGVEPCSSD